MNEKSKKLLENYSVSSDSYLYDPVNLPEHYAKDDAIECIDAMVAAFGEENVQDYCRINAFKYVWRAHQKGKEEEDVKKAIWYLRRSIGEDPRGR